MSSAHLWNRKDSGVAESKWRKNTEEGEMLESGRQTTEGFEGNEFDNTQVKGKKPLKS